MATLVHDDVLDARAAAPRPTDRRRGLGPRARHRRRRPALLACLRAARRGGERRGPSPLLSAAAVALARGELAQRHDAFDTTISEERYLERCRLKTAKLFECACLLGRDDELRSGAFGAGDRPRLPAARRRARRLRAGGADRQGPRHRPARRDRDPAADRGGGRGPRDPVEPTSRARSGRRTSALCERIAATGALERVRARALGMVEEAKRRLDSAGFKSEQRRLLDLVADGVVQRYS